MKLAFETYQLKLKELIIKNLEYEDLLKSIDKDNSFTLHLVASTKAAAKLIADPLNCLRKNNLQFDLMELDTCCILNIKLKWAEVYLTKDGGGPPHYYRTPYYSLTIGCQRLPRLNTWKLVRWEFGKIWFVTRSEQPILSEGKVK